MPIMTPLWHRPNICFHSNSDLGRSASRTAVTRAFIVVIGRAAGRIKRPAARFRDRS